MAESLAGKVIVVTGSTRGIGRAIAEACAAEGATVVVNGRGDATAEVAAQMAAGGARVSGISADISRPHEVQRLFDGVLAEHGRMDVWFNNAGLSGGFRPLFELAPEHICDIVNTNVGGVMLCSRLVIPHMREHGGLIVNICGRGSRGEIAAYGAAYAATKAAVASLTRSVAAENKDATNVAIVGMLPGMVPTDFYENMDVSPSLEDRVENVRVALDAFGASLAEVGVFAARIAAAGPDQKTGEIHSIIGRLRMLRGVAKMARAGMTGRIKRL